MAPTLPVKNYNKLIGERIRFFRKLRGVSQIELAKALGYTSSGTISRIERDGSGMHKSKILQAAKHLAVHPYVLTAEENLNGEQLILLNKFMRILKLSDENSLNSIRTLLENLAEPKP